MNQLELVAGESQETKQAEQTPTLINPQEFGLDVEKAKDVESAFAPVITEQAEYEKMYVEIITKEITPELTKEARELRLKLVKVRTATDKIHKSSKAFYLAAGRFVDAWKNKTTSTNEVMEAKLEEIENYYINLEKQRIEKLKSERLAELTPLGFQYSNGFDLGNMDAAGYESLKRGLEIAKQEKEQAERKAEEERIAKEQAERKAEEERIAKEQAESAERERIRLENEALKAQQEKLEAELKAQREQAEKEAKEAAEKLKKAEAEKRQAEEKANAEQLAQQEKLDQVKREKEAAELAAKKLEEEKFQKEQEESQAKLKAEKSEEEKTDELRMADLVADLEKLKTRYVFKSVANQQIYSAVITLLEKVIVFINSKTQK